MHKSLFWLGTGLEYNKIVGTESGRRRLTSYKCRENRELQGCWKGHEFWKGTGREILKMVPARVRANFSRAVLS